MAPRKKTTKPRTEPKKRTSTKLRDLEARDPGKVRGGGGDWESLKDARVWEANRKTFLYPENWIKP
jgi:hypothetical protein